MMLKGAVCLVLGLCLLVLPAIDLYAQFRQLPVVTPLDQSIDGYRERRTDEALELPFWDDFSSGSIDTLKWESHGVMSSLTIGINPPTVGVCYLDGVDASGSPYSRTRLENGEGDQLISQPLDLSGISSSSGTVFLSFFWQAGGNGEMPDSNDQIQLYFLDITGTWTKIWEQAGGDDLPFDEFNQVIIPVEDTYFHSGFRFKFQHVGRLSGPFDTWLLDYVYLGQNRNAADLFYEDRALTRLPGSPFGNYGAIPLFDLNRNGSEYLSQIEGQFKNLSNRFRAMEYTVLLKNRQTGQVFSQVNLNTPFNPVPQAQERRNFVSRVVEEIDFGQTEAFDLETLMYITTGDGFKIDRIVGRDTTFYDNIDFRVNDTVRYVMPVRDYFSYDNGSVDYSAGINQRSGMLALRYELDTTAFISGISINFTNYLQRGNAIELMVWDTLGQAPVYRKEVLIPEDSHPDTFAYFPIDTNVRISGSYYVGFTQFTNDFIYVGLDKSGDSGENVFYNVYGDWEQNTEVRGNLMIRPHLSLAPVRDRVGEEETSVKAYPNPVNDVLFIEGNVEDVQVFDFQGRTINVQEEKDKNFIILNFADRQKGVYLIRYQQNNKIKTFRILVK